MIRAALLLLALTIAAPAQFVPQYVVGTGVSWDYYGGAGFSGSTDFAARVGQSNVYSFTSLDLTSKQASLRSGAAYTFFNQCYWSLTALGNAGLATGSGPTLGSFTAGGFIAYDIGAKLTKNVEHFYIAVGGRLLNITSQTVQPIFTVTLGRGF